METTAIVCVSVFGTLGIVVTLGVAASILYYLYKIKSILGYSFELAYADGKDTAKWRRYLQEEHRRSYEPFPWFMWLPQGVNHVWSWPIHSGAPTRVTHVSTQAPTQAPTQASTKT